MAFLFAKSVEHADWREVVQPCILLMQVSKLGSVLHVPQMMLFSSVILFWAC